MENVFISVINYYYDRIREFLKVREVGRTEGVEGVRKKEMGRDERFR